MIISVDTEIDDVPVNLQVSVTILPPEPDVGIMSYYIDDWHIKRVDGNQMTPAQVQDWIQETNASREFFENEFLSIAGY